MPIKISEHSTTVTGDDIPLFRMLALRGMLSLEIKGIRMSRGSSAYACIKREFGLKGTKAQVLALFNVLCNAASSKVERINEVAK